MFGRYADIYTAGRSWAFSFACSAQTMRTSETHGEVNSTVGQRTRFAMTGGDVPYGVDSCCTVGGHGCEAHQQQVGGASDSCAVDSPALTKVLLLQGPLCLFPMQTLYWPLTSASNTPRSTPSRRSRSPSSSSLRLPVRTGTDLAHPAPAVHRRRQRVPVSRRRQHPPHAASAPIREDVAC